MSSKGNHLREEKPLHRKHKDSYDVAMTSQLKTCYLFIGNYSGIRKYSNYIFNIVDLISTQNILSEALATFLKFMTSYGEM